MKIRAGFVSNSSSSSFIIGLANYKNGGCIFNVNDIVKSPYNKEQDIIYVNDYEEIFVKEICDGVYKLTYESFTHDIVSCEVKDGDSFVFLSGVGPNDDCFFYDDDFYCNYDKIDLDDFNSEDVSTYNLILKLGGEVKFGAGRDG